MNPRALRPANVSAAAVLIGGVLTLALPQHAMSIFRLVILTAAASAGLYALAVNVPPTGWLSPFKWMAPFNRAVHSEGHERSLDELALIRSWLLGRRQRVGEAPPMPPSMLRILQPLVASALEVSPGDEARWLAARERVSPTTRAVLTTAPLHRPGWLRTLRGDGAAVAAVVNRVLDDLDHLDLTQREPGP